MIKTKANNKYLKSCVIATVMVMMMLLSIFSVAEFSPVVLAAESGSSAPVSPPLKYSYRVEFGGYYVVGISDDWMLNYADNTDVIITIPAEYNDSEEDDDGFGRTYHGKADVVGILDTAFITTLYSLVRIVGVDFSNATNLEYIGGHAFANNSITNLDLMPCVSLNEVLYDAFSWSTSLRTVQLPGSVSIPEAIFADCPSLEYIITQNSGDYAEYAEMAGMEDVAHLLTYEFEVAFDLGGGQTTTKTKLFNLPLSFTKTDGQWLRQSGTLPDTGFSAGKFGVFAGSADGVIITEESSATDTLYQITWITVTKLEVITNFPEGFVTDKSKNTDNLKQYLTVTAYGGDNNEYFREITDYSLNFIGGNNDQMKVYVTALDMKTDFNAPIVPKDNTYIWIIAAAGVVLLSAVAAFAIFIRRKKIITQTVTETITNTVEVPVYIEIEKSNRFPDSFSAREREIGELLLMDMSRKEIANNLILSENTIKKHLSAIYEKAGCATRHEFYRKYYKDKE